MTKKLNCIMLIDDDSNDNFFHHRVIKKYDFADEIVVIDSAEIALEKLIKDQLSNAPAPDLIFVDINMPGMDGWDFLEEYEYQNFKNETIIVMLTSSENPIEKSRAENLNNLSDFKNKPLTKEILEDVLKKWF